jgi:hypothetical protein
MNNNEVSDITIYRYDFDKRELELVVPNDSIYVYRTRLHLHYCEIMSHYRKTASVRLNELVDVFHYLEQYEKTGKLDYLHGKDGNSQIFIFWSMFRVLLSAISKYQHLDPEILCKKITSFMSMYDFPAFCTDIVSVCDSQTAITSLELD